MKYTLTLLVCILLLGSCHKNRMYQFSSRIDTLGSQWGMVEGGHIIYYFQDANSWGDEVPGYINAHEKTYETIDAVFKAQLPQKLRFFVWKDTTLARQQMGRTLGFSIPEQCVCHQRPDQTLGHEMTHVLCYWSGGIRPTYITRFVNEGVAVAFDQNPGSKAERARQATTGQNIHSVMELWSNGNNIDESVLYPVAGAFMEFVYQKGDFASFDSLTKHQSVSDAQQIYSSYGLMQLTDEFNTLIGFQ